METFWTVLAIAVFTAFALLPALVLAALSHASSTRHR